jgi:hypothetical protein
MADCDLASAGPGLVSDTGRVTASAGVVAAASRRIGARLADLIEAPLTSDLPEGFADILARLEAAGPGEGTA